MGNFENNASIDEIASLAERGQCWLERINDDPSLLIGSVALNEQMKFHEHKENVFNILSGLNLSHHDILDAKYRYYHSDDGYDLEDMVWSLKCINEGFVLVEDRSAEWAGWGPATHSSETRVWIFSETSDFPVLVEPKAIFEGHQMAMNQPLKKSKWFDVAQSLIKMGESLDRRQMLDELDLILDKNAPVKRVKVFGQIATRRKLCVENFDRTTWVFTRFNYEDGVDNRVEYRFELIDPDKVRDEVIVELEKENVRPNIWKYGSLHKDQEYYLRLFKAGVKLLNETWSDKVE